MRIALTGATGLLGRNLLFEIIKQNLSDLDSLEILILGRSVKENSLDNRLESIIDKEGSYYLGFNGHLDDVNKLNIFRHSVPIFFDLTHEHLGISDESLQILKRKPIDLFIHIAALTDFRAGHSVEQKLYDVNVNGTKQVIDLIGQLNVKQFVYVGSAYSCGSKVGTVPADYANANETFRNPYEKSKLLAELLVREFHNNTGIPTKIFRPSTICGRLIEPPIGYINKFDVFYAWAAFFLRYKYKFIKDLPNIYKKHLELPIRLHFNPNGGLNIVPVDYAAKLLLFTCLDSDRSGSYHLANEHHTPNKLYADITFDILNISGQSYVLEEPSDKNKTEQLYYKTVGEIFTPYGLSDEIIFSRDNIRDIEAKHRLYCPAINEDNFRALLGFAAKSYFGVINNL
ncbi:MAG: SDR family oxidoreductase [Candidatus Margulisbacteria bacterium]|jgi:nucleoside-diphosphate-sugar epimerase|nr:SDR family oxidoreductase [Candidatus Margulisiibacteriota bacterium]